MNRKFLTYLSLLLVLLCTSATAFADTGGKRLADGEATVFDPPYYEGFDTEEALAKWTQYGNTPYSWTYLNYWGFKDSPCAYLNQSKKNTPCDNWIVSPGIRLKKGMTYAMSFFFHSTVSFDANLEVSYLTSPTDTASAVRILDVNTYENNTYEGELTPAADGVYYIAFHDKTKYHDNGTALRYASFIDEVKVTPKSNNASPAKVENLTCEPGTNGEMSMTLKWRNPSLSRQGEQLDFLSSVTIYRDKNDSTVINNGVNVGAEMTWTDPNPTPGRHTYRVVCGNEAGNSDPVAVNTYIGKDLPGAPENLTAALSADKKTIQLAWAAPKVGRYGGWYDPNGLTYRVVRKPDGKVLATNLADTTLTDDQITAYGKYFYEVTARNNDGTGATSTSSTVKAGMTADLPIREDWENSDTYPMWTIADNTGEGYVFYINHAQGYDSPTAIGVNYIGKNINTSLYSAPVKLEKGKTYKFTTKVRSNSFQSFSMDVTYGKDTTVNAQRNTIEQVIDGTTEQQWSYVTKEFTPTSTATAYIGIRLYNVTSNYVWLDDIRIEEIHKTNLEATAIRNTDTAPTVGEQVTTGVTYTNTGTARVSKFTVQLLDDDDNVIGEKNVSRPLAANGTGTATINWTPKQEGKMSIRGRVVADGDECAADDYTKHASLNVLPEKVHAVTVGTGEDVNSNLPFPRSGVAFNQTIYAAKNFGGKAGVIDSIAYKVRFSQTRDYMGVPFKIYMGTTEQENMNSGWIPASQMQLVFDGKLDLVRGIYDFVIPFDHPFNYNGGNVTIMVVGDYDQDLFTADGYGIGVYATEVGLGASRAGSVMDPFNPNQDDGAFSSYVPNTMFFINSETYGSVKGTVTDADGKAVKGAKVVSSSYPYLTSTTNENGEYALDYFPAGWSRLTASAVGYADASKSIQVESGKQTEANITGMKVAPKITVSGTVTDRNDKTPVAGVEITLVGSDSTYTAKSDAEGKFTITNVYANKVYHYTATAEDYNTTNSAWRFGDYDVADGVYNWDKYGCITMSPTAVYPSGVTATDDKTSATVKWTKPIQPLTLAKGGDPIGQFGGKYNMSVGQRFTAEQLKEKGVDGEYYVTRLRYVPMCAATYTLKIWQGKEGSEAEVYSEKMNVETYGVWNEYRLKTPFKLDPTQSTIIGYTVDCGVGAYPLAFDAGKAVDGGDCLFDSELNAWSTARAALPGQMDYNWCIEAVLGANDNSSAVAWAPALTDSTDTTQAKAPAKARKTPLTVTYEVAKTAEGDGYAAQWFVEEARKQLAAQGKAKAPEANKQPAGYNVYRLLCGDEANTGNWTKVNESVVKDLTFTDNTWKDIEDKPYRYAVRSVYGTSTESDPTFSDGVDKGHYASVTIKVTAKSGDVEGAEVKLFNDYDVRKANVKADGTVVFDKVRFADYALQVLKPYYVRYIDTVSVNESEQTLTANVAIEAKLPVSLAATDLVNNVDLKWTQPSTAINVELTKSTKSFAGLVGKSGDNTTVVLGQRFTPADLKANDYTEFYLDSISFYSMAPATYKLRVWSGPEGSEMDVYSQECVVTDTAKWVSTKLNTPVLIDPKKSYIIGYEVTPEKGVYACAYDGGPVVTGGDLLYSYSSADRAYEWTPMSYVSEIRGNWMITGHLTTDPDAASKKDENIGYKVWRLKDADKADPSKWTLLTADATDQTDYSDNSWKQLADGDKYLYAVRSVYFGSVESEPAYSKTIEKGKLALVTVNVATDNNVAAEGAVVKLANDNRSYTATVAADGSCRLVEVEKGKYTLTIEKEGYETYTAEQNVEQSLTTIAATINVSKDSPVYAKAVSVDGNDAVSLTWRAPNAYAPVEGWVYWDTNKVLGGMGTSTGQISVGQLFDTVDQTAKGMKELSVSKISFYVNNTSDDKGENPTWTVKIWRVLTTGVQEAYSQDVTDVKLGAWNEVTLNTPYYISGDEPLLIGYEYKGKGRVIGVDKGPAVANKGDWGNTGSGWASFSQAASLDYNVLVHTYCADLGQQATEAAPMEQQPRLVSEPDAIKGVTTSLMEQPAEGADHVRKAAAESYVLGYKVYRLAQDDNADESKWTLLTQEPVKETSLKDTAWKQLQKQGAYLWAIKAVYASGDSKAVFTNALNADGTNGIEEVAGDLAVKVGPNPCEGEFTVTVPAQAEMTVTSMGGQIVDARTLQQGDNHVAIDVPHGVYLVVITLDGERHATKLVVR